MKKNAFSLIEIMVVIAIIGVLVMLAFPTFTQLLAKAKRTEALVQLRALYTAEKIYFLEHGHYSKDLVGPQGIGWLPDGYKKNPNEENFLYTYGFPGIEGINYVVGKSKADVSLLQDAFVDKEKFMACAVGFIKDTKTPDIIAINEAGVIVILKNALE